MEQRHSSKPQPWQQQREAENSHLPTQTQQTEPSEHLLSKLAPVIAFFLAHTSEPPQTRPSMKIPKPKEDSL